MRKLAMRAAYRLSSIATLAAAVGWVWSRMNSRLPLDRLYESDELVAFHHPRPGYDVHVVLVPKKPLQGVSGVDASHGAVLAELYAVAGRLADDLGLRERGYRVVVNSGAYQHVPQFHAHLIAGASRNLEPPEGI